MRHRAQVLFVSHLFTRLSWSTFHIEIAPMWVPSSGSPIQEFRFMHIANQTHKKPHLSSLDVAGSSSAPQGPQLHSRLGPNSVSLWNEHGVRVDMPLPEETRVTPTKMSVLGWSTIIIACISTGEEGQIHHPAFLYGIRIVWDLGFRSLGVPLRASTSLGYRV